MRKGSMLFMPLLLLIVITSLTVAFYLMHRNQSPFSITMGEDQGAILATESRAEKALFYIDRSARYAAETSAQSLAEMGGYYDIPACGTYLGVVKWNTKTEECWPEKAEEEFAKYFTDEIRERLAAYPDIPLAYLKYQTVMDQRVLYATAEEPILIDILRREPYIIPEDIAVKKQMIADEVTESFKPPPSVAIDTDYAWPGQSTVITSCYGWRNIDYGSTEHRGIDIRAAVGDPVYSIADGKAKISNDKYNTLSVEHKEGLVSMYIHNSEILVLDKQEVKKGQIVALAGKAGTITPHIHLTIKKGRDYLDPLDPANRIFDITKLTYKSSANCIYACNQYSYCGVMMERKAK